MDDGMEVEITFFSMFVFVAVSTECSPDVVID